MSGFEIERKFLVRKDIDFRARAHTKYSMRQGYIPAKGATVRIRLRDDKGFLTIKGPASLHGLLRYEFEKEISPVEANELLKLCTKPLIEKTRYLIDEGGHTFEVDEFYGDNEGLIIAEIELKKVSEDFERPDFLGKEVTGDDRFYNSQLRLRPFCLWKDELEDYK